MKWLLFPIALTLDIIMFILYVAFTLISTTLLVIKDYLELAIHKIAEVYKIEKETKFIFKEDNNAKSMG